MCDFPIFVTTTTTTKTRNFVLEKFVCRFGNFFPQYGKDGKAINVVL